MAAVVERQSTQNTRSKFSVYLMNGCVFRDDFNVKTDGECVTV